MKRHSRKLITVLDDNLVEYTATVNVYYTYEEKDGSDADGNRGQPVYLLDDIDIVEVVDPAGIKIIPNIDLMDEIYAKVQDLELSKEPFDFQRGDEL